MFAGGLPYAVSHLTEESPAEILYYYFFPDPEAELLLGCVFLSYGYHNKVPQTEWLNIAGMNCFIVLEARSLQSRYWQGHAPSEGSGRESFFASSGFWWSIAILVVPRRKERRICVAPVLCVRMVLSLWLCVHMAVF